MKVFVSDCSMFYLYNFCNSLQLAYFYHATFIILLLPLASGWVGSLMVGLVGGYSGRQPVGGKNLVQAISQKLLGIGSSYVDGMVMG